MSAAAPELSEAPVTATALLSTRVYVGNIPYTCSWQSLKDFVRNELADTSSPSTSSSTSTSTSSSSECGVQHVDVLMYPSGRSKGCAIIEFDTRENAARAINTLNGKTYDGRKLFLRADREQPSQDSNTPAPTHTNARRPPRKQHDVEGSTNDAASHSSSSSSSSSSSTTSSSSDSASSTSASSTSNGDDAADGNQLYVGNISWRATWQDLKDLCTPFGPVLRADVIYDRRTGRSKGFGIVRFQSAADAKRALDELNEKPFQGRNLFLKFDNYVRNDSSSNQQN